MKARVTFIMDVPEGLMLADGTGINVNLIADLVRTLLPTFWVVHVTVVEEKESPSVSTNCKKETEEK